MKIKGIVTVPQPIVDSQRSGGYRAVRLVLRQDTAGAAVFKKLRDIFNIPDIWITVDRVAVVKMETIVKMVGVNYGGSQQNEAGVK